MADTSLVFNLVARDRASQTMERVKGRMAEIGAAAGAGMATAMGVGLMQNLNMEAASDKLAAQLGIGPAKAAELSKVSATVYQNAWGDSIETVNDAVRGVYQNIGDTSTAEGGIKGITEKVLALAHTFDQDVNAATAAAGQLMKTGLAKNADQALDLITRGFQTGANKADDLLDTINEYSTQWRKFGLDGKAALGLLSQGLKAGARDADLVADTIKEFSIRALDGSEATAAGFDAIGLDAKTMAARIAKGGDDATAALDETLTKLRGMGDTAAREQTAVALFGSTAEDMGDALFALDPSKATAAMGKVGGAAEKMGKTVHDNGAAKLEEFKRKSLAAFGEVARFALDNKEWVVPLVVGLASLAAVIMSVNAATRAFTAVSGAVKATGKVFQSTAAKAIGSWIKMAAKATLNFAKIAARATMTALKTAAAWARAGATMVARFLMQVIRVTVVTLAKLALMAARATVWALRMAAQWFIAMGPIGWVIAAIVGLAVLIIANWDKIKKWTKAAWEWVWNKIKAIAGAIVNFFLNWTIVGRVIKHWDQIKAGTKKVWNSVVSWVKGIPGRIVRALGDLNSLLYNSGLDVVRGLWNGIKAMGSWLRSTLIGWARNLIPGPIADALGIASPSKVLADEVGRWIPAGISMGITTNLDQVRAAADMAAQAAIPGVPRPMTTHTTQPLLMNGALRQRVHVVIDVDGADEDMKRMFRKMTRVDGGGVVQAAFGRKRR